MKINKMICLVCSTMFFFGNLRADVAPIFVTDLANIGSPNYAASSFVDTGPGTGWTSQIITRTTMSSSIILAGIGLYTRVDTTPNPSPSGSGTIRIHDSSEDVDTNDSVGSFSVVGAQTGGYLSVTWGQGVGQLNSNKTYDVLLSSSSLSAEDFITANGPGSVMFDYQYDIFGMVTSNQTPAMQFYAEATVPEPGTLILTGTALVAGAVGAYIKRRRKANAEIAV